MRTTIRGAEVLSTGVFIVAVDDDSPTGTDTDLTCVSGGAGFSVITRVKIRDEYTTHAW